MTPIKHWQTSVETYSANQKRNIMTINFSIINFYAKLKEHRKPCFHLLYIFIHLFIRIRHSVYIMLKDFKNNNECLNIGTKLN